MINHPPIDADSIREYMLKYVENNFHCLDVPRLLERPDISGQFVDWDAYVRKKHFVRPIIILKEYEEYGKHFDSPLFCLNIYSSNIYPHYVVCSKGQSIVWDSHYWDLFGFFIMITSNVIFFKQKYTGVWKTKAKKDFAKTRNCLNSLMLLYLTHRYESNPYLSYIFADIYKRRYPQIPVYDHTFAISNNKRVYCNPEEYLKSIGLLWVSDFAKEFVFLHECTHVKMRTQPSERKIECDAIRKYCELFNLYSEMNIVDNSNYIKHLVYEIYDKNNTALAEEIFCDVNAIINLYEDVVDKSGNTTEAMLAVNYLLSFQYWLKIADTQWNILTNILKTPLPESGLRKKARNLEYEYMVANARQNIVWSIVNHKTNGKINYSHNILDWEWFSNKFLLNATCYSLIEEIMSEYRKVQNESKTPGVLREERNKLIGWKDRITPLF